MMQAARAALCLPDGVGQDGDRTAAPSRLLQRNRQLQKKLCSKRGTLIYLDASLVLQATLERVVAAGDVMALPRQALPPGMGVFAHIGDLDGNFDLRASRPAPW